MSPEPFREIHRDRAIELLQRAYGDGLIDEPELEYRLDLAFKAKDQAGLRLALQGLPAQLPVPSQGSVSPAPYRSGAVSYPPPPNTDQLATLANLSALISGPIGPALCWFMSQGQGWTHHEITEALNFQILAGGIWFVLPFASMLFSTPYLFLVWGMIWLTLTLTGASKTHRRENWENPLLKLTRFRPVKEMQR